MSTRPTDTVVGTGGLVRLALRRDRVVIPVWLAVFVVTAASSASATVGLYPTVASRVQAAAAINNVPALVALYGRLYDPTSLGALAMLKMGSLGTAMVGVLSMMLVVRHTRAEEESGRLELVGAAVVGRQAALTAALLVVTGTSVALGALSACALIATGLPVAGSVAFGLGWTGTGLAFAAVAAVAAQLTSGARAANAITGAVIGLAYLLRAVGDTSGPGRLRWASWLSPLGWGQLARPFAADRWWVFTLLVVFAVAAVAAAFVLNTRRDAGAGLLADRPGPATASPVLGSSLGLAWRLQRGLLMAWVVGFALLGLVLGAIASNVGTLLSSPQAREMITRLGGLHGLTDAFLAAELSITGVIASAYGIQAALRLHSEESALRAEPLLATATSRLAWACSHTLVAFAGTLTMLAVAGLSAGLVHAAHTGEGTDVGRVLAGALVQVPATWVLTSIVIAAFGLAPRLIAAGWTGLVVFLLIGELGPLFQLEQWALDLSPFTHAPRLPGGSFSAAPLLWLLLLSAALTGAGLAGFRRRDVC